MASRTAGTSRPTLHRVAATGSSGRRQARTACRSAGLPTDPDRGRSNDAADREADRLRHLTAVRRRERSHPRVHPSRGHRTPTAPGPSPPRNHLPTPPDRSRRPTGPAALLRHRTSLPHDPRNPGKSWASRGGCLLPRYNAAVPLSRFGGLGTPAMPPTVDHPEADQNKHRPTDGPTQGGTIAIVADAHGEKENGQGQPCPVEGPVQPVGYRRLAHSLILTDAY